MAFWGTEVNVWDATNASYQSLDNYIAALKYVNANTIALLFAWAQFEKNEGTFGFDENSYAQYCIDESKKAGLRIIIYYGTSNYASGDSYFTPDWVINDKNKYSRTKVLNENGNPITGTNWSGGTFSSDCGDDALNPGKPEKSTCAVDPDLHDAEESAVRELFRFIGRNNDDDTILGVNMFSEFDYSRTWAMDQANANHNYRCHCENCDALFQQEAGFESETELQFMQRKYNEYVRDMVYAAQEEYNGTALYVAVAGLYEFPLGRYAEQPQDIYPLIGRPNVFVCPSVGAYGSEQIFKVETDKFTGKTAGYETLDGNPAFGSGLAADWIQPPYYHHRRVDFAPWMYLAYYGGLGAVYWDNPGDDFSVLKSVAYRTRYKNSWSVLKAAEYYISIFKNSPEVFKFWSYNTQKADMTLGKFTVKIERDDPYEIEDYDNFGFAMLYDTDDLVFGSTQHDSDWPPEVKITTSGSLNGYKAEYGAFSEQGAWVKYADANVSPSGKTATVSLDRGADKGFTARALVRVYKG
jgi:hypothetical protein